ncbi:hypothetical protein BRD06_06050 [Halobacteriales archaeon QS_9_67_15]|nr:MAG: hypothetical protein BRD06_06050 [Halobacteriales archaeon QS_9_67_15]
MSDDHSDETDREDGAADRERDPLDSFEGYDDREGDPFQSLDAGDTQPDPESGAHPQPDSADSTTENGSATDAPSTGPADGDPFEYMDDHTGPDSGRGDSASGSARGSDPGRGRTGDPLTDVDVSDEDPFESNASAFDRSGVEGIDPDDVWERFTAESDADGEPESSSDATDTAAGPATEAEDDVVRVSKHSYCEGCEYFSPPPDVRCGHEGTEIIEFVDIDAVRIADCPVVEERRELDESV